METTASDAVGVDLSRLNRTMQYGNQSNPSTTLFPIFCLNRTMQYGNKKCSVLIFSGKFCLNRTMQYGNDKYK